MANDSLGDVLARLFAVIEQRRDSGDPETSYVARRLAQGTPKIAQKLGEEAVETVIAALGGERREVVNESADLIFHLMMVWADAGVSPEEVLAELERRFGTSGLDEKAARG
jgi:phosphoribosyl-ATP pyrophosphohydrolase